MDRIDIMNYDGLVYAGTTPILCNGAAIEYIKQKYPEGYKKAMDRACAALEKEFSEFIK